MANRFKFYDNGLIRYNDFGIYFNIDALSFGRIDENGFIEDLKFSKEGASIGCLGVSKEAIYVTGAAAVEGSVSIGGTATFSGPVYLESLCKSGLPELPPPLDLTEPPEETKVYEQIPEGPQIILVEQKEGDTITSYAPYVYNKEQNAWIPIRFE